MLIDPMYYAIFYDVDLPKNDYYAMRKRISYLKWTNLLDDMGTKTITLDGVQYIILEIRTFKIINTVDNTLYLIADVEKVKT